MESGLIEVMLRVENLIVMVSAWAIISIAQKVFPALVEKPLWVRLQPVMPLVWCCVFIWMPGLRPEDKSVGFLLLLGIILGWASAWVFKAVKQGIMGKDKVIEAAKLKLEGP